MATATFTDDFDWVCTTEIEEELLKLYETDRVRWHQEISLMVQSHPSKFEILNVGTTHDADGHDPATDLFTFEEFASHFVGHPGTIHNEKLLRLIYDDVEHAMEDDDHVKLIDIHLWFNNKRKHRKSVVVRDEHWLYDQIAKIQIPDIDTDLSGDVDRDEFRAHFVDKCGIDSEIADAIFDDIDQNDDGRLSVLEYMKWKSMHTRPPTLRQFSAASPRSEGPIASDLETGGSTPRSRSSSDDEKEQTATVADSKCPRCDALGQLLVQSNHKHDALALQFATEDPEWECSEQLQLALVQLHEKDPKEWHIDIVTMVHAHPSKFEILNVLEMEEDSQKLYTFDEFAEIFKEREGSIHNEQLLRLMFDSMDHSDADHVTSEAIDRFINSRITNNVSCMTENVAFKLKIAELEQEKLDLQSKLDTKTTELDVSRSQTEYEALERKYEELESKYNELESKHNALIEELSDEEEEAGSSVQSDRTERGRAIRKKLDDEDTGGGFCSYWSLKDH